MPDSKKDPTSKESNHIPDFERKLEALEKIVAEMERGEMSLEESLQAYERGVKLTHECQNALDSAQQRIKVLTEKNGALSEEPFNEDSSEDEAS